MMSGVLSNTFTYILVFVRMAGMIGFNPILNRNNLPAQVRVGMIFTLTILLAPNLHPGNAAIFTSMDLVVAILKELMVGIACGFVFQIFYYLLFFIGDLMDTQFGMSMAKVFDPGTNIQTSISGNLLNMMFILYIFATDSHLLLIHLFATSYDVVSMGAVRLSPDIAQYLLHLFISAFSLAIRLAVPFIAAEFVLELSMGILMKLIPQIHVFVINIQFKILLAMLLLLLFAAPIASFIDNYIKLVFESMRDMLFVLST